MPQNKRESLIFTIIMCFTMVLWMSMYNVTLHMGGFSMTVLKEGWLGFPFAYIYAMCFDWFVVSHLAKSVAFRFFVKPDSAPLKKAIAVSCCMVIPMVIVMSFYGKSGSSCKSGMWSLFASVWITNIPKNLIMALPFQLIICRTFVRSIPANPHFRKEKCCINLCRKSSRKPFPVCGAFLHSIPLFFSNDFFICIFSFRNRALCGTVTVTTTVSGSVARTTSLSAAIARSFYLPHHRF